MIPSPRRLLVPAALFCLASLVTDAGAQPGAPTPAAVPVEILILHGTNDGSGIDPKLGRLPELGKPPFSSYNSYKLLERSRQTLTTQGPTSMKTPTGANLRLSLKEIVEPQKRDQVRRYVISSSIQKPGGNSFLPLLEVSAKAGQLFFVAGQEYKGGALVFGIKVSP